MPAKESQKENSMQNPYEQPINSNKPGFFVILIDQSLSMSEEFGETK